MHENDKTFKAVALFLKTVCNKQYHFVDVRKMVKSAIKAQCAGALINKFRKEIKMAITDDNMVLPVQPLYNGGGYNNNGGFFGGGDSWLGILFLIALLNGGWGGFGGFGGFGGYGAMMGMGMMDGGFARKA